MLYEVITESNMIRGAPSPRLLSEKIVCESFARRVNLFHANSAIIGHFGVFLSKNADFHLA